MGNFFRLHKIPLLLFFTGCLFYFSFAYDLERADFIKLLMLYLALMFVSWKFVQLEKNNFWFLAGAAVIFRLIFLAALPNLSQDFYRFIWDGGLLIAGWDPYLYLPEDLIAEGAAPFDYAIELVGGMGALSAGNYTNYPPLNQLLFALAGVLGGKSILGSVITLRLIIIAADIGIIYFGKKILEHLNLPVHRIFWFILNPLVIIELTGNLHFEGVMLFFLLWSIYLLLNRRWIFSAFTFAASILIKLMPLIFLPLMIRYFLRNKDQELGIWRLLGFNLIVGVIIIAGFLPFLSGAFYENFAASMALWFQKFEFNAGFYYIIRWIGYQEKGYNIIETAGKALPIVVILLLGILAFFRKDNSLKELITTLLFGITIYFLFSTTIHPWYLATPLLLSVFTRFKYMLVWSVVVMLSYSTYSNPEFQENLWLIALEYLLVFGYVIYEFLNFRKVETRPEISSL